MWRKLTSLLFEEEEIILEEEELTPQKEVKIEPVAPLVDKKVEAEPFDTIEIDAIDDSFVETVLEEKPKKSVMIDLEEETIVQEPKPRIFDKAKEEYKRRSILSPMHGGDETEDLPQKPKETRIKKHQPVTQVISPMYGNIHEDENDEDVIEEDLMDIDLKGMIYEEENDDEVQTSLYDFLEGLEKNNE